MLTSAQPVAFVPSTDLDRSRAFYGTILGLPVTHQDGFAVVVQSGALTVRITNVGPTLNPAPLDGPGAGFWWQVTHFPGSVATRNRRMGRAVTSA